MAAHPQSRHAHRTLPWGNQYNLWSCKAAESVSSADARSCCRILLAQSRREDNELYFDKVDGRLE
eukprot:49111-Eustigmatos_ZCMA.PRE.1